MRDQYEINPEFETIFNQESESELLPEYELPFPGSTSRKSKAYIQWVQSSLNQILGLRLAVDGIQGAMTSSAIRSFQKQKGLLVDGIVGVNTEAAIKAALGKAPVNARNMPLRAEELLNFVKPRAALKNADNIPIEIPLILPNTSIPQLTSPFGKSESATQKNGVSFSLPTMLTIKGVLGKYIDPPTSAAKAIVRTSRETIKNLQKELRSLPGMLPDHLSLLPFPKKLPEALYTRQRINVPLPKSRQQGVHEPTTVFSPDERMVFRDTAYPWSSIGRVETPGSGGFSGVLVGPRHLLTCSHGIQWLSGGTGWIKFTPAYFDGGTPPFGSAFGIQTYYYIKVNGSDGIDREEGQYDYVVVVLNSRIGERAGYMGARSWSDDWDGGSYWNHVGYPDDITATQRPTFQDKISLDGSFWDREVHTRIFHKGDVWPGQSGGPFFAWWKNEFYPSVVCVQSGQTTDENSASGGADMVELIARARKEYP